MALGSSGGYVVEPLSAVVICYNEATRISSCLESLSWADEIVVVDSFSTDSTVEIARRFTDKVYQHAWQGYGAQKNIAVSLASHDWILSVDADEVVSRALASEIKELLEQPLRYAAYRIPRISFYMGRFLRHCWYPDYKVRLFSRQLAHWDSRSIHEAVRVQGPIGTLKGRLLHYSFPSIDDHIATIQTYTSLGAAECAQARSRFVVAKLLVSPVAMFLKLYVLKRGFLDGIPGLIASVLSAVHEFVKYAKYYELCMRTPSPRSNNHLEASSQK